MFILPRDPSRSFLLPVRGQTHPSPFGGICSLFMKPFSSFFHLNCFLWLISPTQLPVLHRESPGERRRDGRAGRAQAGVSPAEWERLCQSEVLEATRASLPVTQAHAIVRGQRHTGGHFVGLQKFGHCVFLGL